MKYFLIILLLSVVTVLKPTSSSAQTATPTTHQEVRLLRTDSKQVKADIRANFREKLIQIKNTQKQKIVGRIDERITSSNTKRTAQMEDALNRMSTILDKLDTKIATSTPPQSTKDIVSTAHTQIDSAKSLVETQKTKDYVIELTTDTALRNDVKAALQQYISDIRSTHQAVIDARTAVINAIKSFKSGIATITPVSSEEGGL